MPEYSCERCGHPFETSAPDAGRAAGCPACHATPDPSTASAQVRAANPPAPPRPGFGVFNAGPFSLLGALGGIALAATVAMDNGGGGDMHGRRGLMILALPGFLLGRLLDYLLIYLPFGRGG